jgi:hypothetical protein
MSAVSTAPVQTTPVLPTVHSPIPLVREQQVMQAVKPREPEGDQPTYQPLFPVFRQDAVFIWHKVAQLLETAKKAVVELASRVMTCVQTRVFEPVSRRFKESFNACIQRLSRKQPQEPPHSVPPLAALPSQAPIADMTPFPGDLTAALGAPSEIAAPPPAAAAVALSPETQSETPAAATAVQSEAPAAPTSEAPVKPAATGRWWLLGW